MAVNYGAAGGGAIIKEIPVADLELTTIVFQPGRTREVTVVDRLTWMHVGKLNVIDFGISCRFTNAGGTSIFYIGLPTYIPRITGPLATSVSRQVGNSTTGPVPILLAMSVDAYDSGRNFVQFTRLSNAWAAVNWPISPAAAIEVLGQLTFST